MLWINKHRRIISALIVAFCGFVVFDFPPGLSQRVSLDLLLRLRSLLGMGQVAELKEVLTIQMDEGSYASLKQDLDKGWDRAVHARLVDGLVASGAKAVVFDIVFEGATNLVSTSAVGTEHLVTAISNATHRGTHVVLAARSLVDEFGVRGVQVPYGMLINAASAVGQASSFWEDPDGGIRRPNTDSTWDDLGTATLKLLEPDWTGYGTNRWIHYYGPRGTIPTMTYATAMESTNLAPAVGGKVVFVGGGTVPQHSRWYDAKATPFGRHSDELVNGVEIHATRFLNLLRRDGVAPYSTPVKRFWVIALGALLGFGFARLAFRKAVLYGLILSVFILAYFTLTLGTFGTWGPWVVVIGVEIPLAILLSQLLVYDVFVSYRHASAKTEAHLIFAALESQGIRVFVDDAQPGPGELKQVILPEVVARPNFVLLLSEETLIRCQEPKDWVRAEIEQAMAHRRNIIPVDLPAFVRTDAEATCPDSIAGILAMRAIQYEPNRVVGDLLPMLRPRFSVFLSRWFRGQK